MNGFLKFIYVFQIWHAQVKIIAVLWLKQTRLKGPGSPKKETKIVFYAKWQNELSIARFNQVESKW